MYSSSRDGPLIRHVDTEAQPSQQAVRHGATQHDILDEGVTLLGLGAEDIVLGIGGLRLSVARIGLGSFDKSQQGLIEESLTDMRSRC